MSKFDEKLSKVLSEAERAPLLDSKVAKTLTGIAIKQFLPDVDRKSRVDAVNSVELIDGSTKTSPWGGEMSFKYITKAGDYNIELNFDVEMTFKKAR